MLRNEYLDECLKENKGNEYLLRAYNYTLESGIKALTIYNFGYIYENENELNDFRNELDKAGIKEFILIESNGRLIEMLHALDSVGIKINGLCTYTKINCERIEGNWECRDEKFKGLKMMVE